jgi:TP901 family phage tail tape measure protein
MVAILGVDTTGLVQANTAMLTFEKRVTTSLNTMSQRFRTFGYLATAAVTAPMLMASRSVLKMASDYEFSMQKIVGLTGAAQEDVNQWSETILRMSKDTARAPKELAEGMYFISSSGIKGAEALDVLALSAKASTSGMGQTQEVAQVLTSALNAYRGTGLTAAYATDVLVAAVREGKAEASGFSTALGQIIPIASQLNVPFDQVAGGMAAITLTGASAANAAVYLKGVFNSLLTASTQGEQALVKMGSSYSDLRKILAEQGLVALMQRLRDMQVKYGDELVSNVLPNIRALTGYLSLAGKNFQYNTALMQRVTESSGTLSKAFEAVADTIKVRYDTAIASANVAMIAFGKSLAEAVLPILESLVRGLNRAVKWYESLSEAGRKNVLIAAAVVAALGPLSLMISLIGYTVSGLISLVTRLTIVLRTATVAIGTAMKINPVLAMIAIMGGLILRWVLLRDKVKAVSEEQKALNALVKEGLALQESATPIASRMSIVTSLNQDQLKTLKENIALQKSLEQEHMSDIVAQAKKILDQDIKTQQLREKIQAAASDTYKLLLLGQLNAREEFLTKDLNAEYEATQARIKLLEGYLATVFPMIQEVTEEVAGGIADSFNEAHYALEKYNQALEAMNNKSVTPSFNAPDYTKLLKFGAGPPTLLESVTSELSRVAAYNKMVGESSNTLTDQIEVYKSAMQTLFDSEEYRTGGADAIAVMGQLISEYDGLIAQQDKLAFSVRRMASTLSNALTDVAMQLGSVFAGTEGAWMGIVDTLLQTASSVINVFLAEAAAALLMHKAVTMPIGGLIAGAIAVGALMALWEGYKGSLNNAAQMKEGGVVPPGYPNDTFPALLSTGETVVPYDAMAKSQQGSITGDVHFYIEGDRLVGILEKRRKVKSKF